MCSLSASSASSPAFHLSIFLSDRLSSNRLAILLVDDSLAICINMPCIAQGKEIISFQHWNSQNLGSVIAQERASCHTFILLSNASSYSIRSEQQTKAPNKMGLYWINRFPMLRRSGGGEACFSPADQGCRSADQRKIALMKCIADLGFVRLLHVTPSY